jgi:sugar/nucleoside kinase (ribokinase family)
MKKNNIILWGDLCIDKNNLDGQEVDGPGGSVFYCGRTFKNLGCEVSIVSPRGSDYNDDWLEGTSIYPKISLSGDTLLYQNSYNSKGERTLYVKNQKQAFFADPLSFGKEFFSGIQAVIVCPIDNNISHSHVKDLKARMNKKSLLACLPQGFFRRYDKGGKVYQSQWENSEKFIPFFDIIIISEQDCQNPDQNAENWSRGRPLVIVTKAEKGCAVFEKGKRIDYPAFKVQEIVDPVGAGDVFSAAFIYSYLNYKNIEKAAVFANAAAAISLSFHVLEMNISVEEVKELIVKRLK